MSLMFNISDLNNLIKDFYTLTKIRTVIFDDSMHELVAYPNRHSTYCQLIRTNKLLEENCHNCDYRACMECKNNQQHYYTYQCHAGLTESVVPIKADNIIVGYIMFGQILQADSKDKLWKEISSNMKQYEINIEELYKAFLSMKVISQDEIIASAKMMEICASYLYLSRKIILKKDTLAQKIDTYINSHIREDLSANIICKKFNISRSRLYKICAKSFGTGIAQHIRNIRINYAKKLLVDTNLPIYKIAEAVGIDDYNYFTKVFKRETHVLPSQYRKENQL